MKTFTLFLATIALGGATLSASPAASTCCARYAYNVSDVSCGQSIVRVGSSDKEVLAILGVPQGTSKDVWMYRNCRARETSVAERSDCTQLVVSFKAHTVVDLKLVSPAAASHIVARAQLGQPIAYASASIAPVAANP